MFARGEQHAYAHVPTAEPPVEAPPHHIPEAVSAVNEEVVSGAISEAPPAPAPAPPRGCCWVVVRLVAVLVVLFVGIALGWAVGVSGWNAGDAIGSHSRLGASPTAHPPSGAAVDAAAPVPTTPAATTTPAASASAQPTVAPPSRSPSPDGFGGPFSAARSVCDVSNIVLNRDLQTAEGAIPDPAQHPHPQWSVSRSMVSASAELPVCVTPAELLASVRDGVRARASPSEPSYFMPSGCAPAWRSPEAACAVVSRYASISFVGDSLLRHAFQGFATQLSGDWIHGALPRLSTPPELYSMCECDGQFSEHVFCRTYSDYEFTMPNTHAYGVCPFAPPAALYYFNPEYGPGDSWQVTPNSVLHYERAHFCSPDPRPRAVLLQGGGHYDSNAARFWPEHAAQHLAVLADVLTACPHRLHVVLAFTGLNTQADFQDGRFPWQGPAQALAFNADMEARLAAWTAAHNSTPFERVTPFHTLSFMALTARGDARPAMSDGYHYLEEVNLVKANYVLALLDLLAGE